ncbi:MAG: aspartate 1-decarboxylase [Candidatus Goldbacteria bacterium]|nr:aspartate 1-decarboxylase [Candidatus Goldiibacteriota bacterium]
MLIEILKSKIHRAVITDKNINYEGSITIDSALLEKAGIYEGEKAYIYNINNGARFETYVIKGKKNSGVICLNGAAARLAEIGDIIIIVTYGLIDEKEVKNYKPRIVQIIGKNKIKR